MCVSWFRSNGLQAMSLTRRDHLAIRWGLGVVALLATIRAADAGIRKYSTLEVETMQAQALVSRAAALVSKSAAFEEQLSVASAELVAQSTGLVGGESIGDAAAATSALVSRWAFASGASVHEIETSVADSGAAFRRLEIRAGLEGTLEAIVALLDSLESSNILLTVSRLSIDAQREATLSVRAEVTGWLHPTVTP